MPSTPTDRLRGLTTSVAVKSPVRVASTGNLVLSSTQVIDGIAVSTGDRVLVKDQTVATENGIYEVDSATWSRAADFDGQRDCVKGTLVYVSTGVFYGNRFFAVTSTGINVPDGSSTISLASAGVFGSTITVSTFAETLLDDSSASNMRATLGAAGTTDANTFAANSAQKITRASVLVALIIESTLPGAGEAPSVFLDCVSSSPAANDLGGAVVQRFNNAAGVTLSGVKWGSRLVTPTSDVEDCDAIVTTRRAGSLGIRAIIGAGMQIGSPTGGDKGIGTINVSSDIYSNNSSYTNPDYAVEHWATGKIEKFSGNQGASDYPGLMPLPMLETFMLANLHLPRVPRESVGAFRRTDIVLEKIEEIFIHLINLNDRLTKVEMAVKST